ncbi:SGNH/GDSL hydrolase family protein [Priestia megaterium]|uniref:SGNH/GDSL hydrolase family protein n=1 Tax=Priestia megaterium TaxID=1404 RepID=UPI002D7F3263|nr:SGNH/GDSL hydrolase family protein [Priestia megaterium]MEB4856079.1 SGNH/GDSL hydrolase family protein [Priestia megaterium]
MADFGKVALSKIGDLSTNKADKSDLTSKADKTYVDTKVATIANGSPKGAYATLTDLQTAFPTGTTGTYVVQADGKLYGWINSAWTAITQYQSSGIAAGSVAKKQTTFFKASKNLFDKSAVTTGYSINYSTGATLSATGLNASDFIPVLPQTTYTRSFKHSIAYYDANKVFISGLQSTSASNKNTLATPANCYFVRFTVDDASLNTMQFELGSESTSYIDYSGKLESTVEIEGKSISIGSLPADRMDFVTKSSGQNLFDKSKVTAEVGVVYNTGATIPLTGYSTSDYIPVSPEKWYFRSYVHSICYYDANKVFISGEQSSTASNPFFTPSNCAFVRVTVINTSLDTMQLKKGVKQTNYEPYTVKYSLNENTINRSTWGLENVWKDKKFVWNGDSIPEGWTPTTGYEKILPYPIRVASYFDAKLDNKSIGGSVIAVKESDPTTRNPIVTRFQDMPNDADLVVIAGITNDWNYTWTPIGTMTDRTNFTLYGALHNLILGLIEKYPAKPILFMSPIKRDTDPNKVNGNGKTLKEYVDILKEVCRFYGVPVLDMFSECTINPSIPSHVTNYIPDGTHPNNAGHEIMTRRVVGYLKQFA